MPQQLKRTDYGTGPFVEIEEVVEKGHIGEEIPLGFVGEEIPEDQWKEDEEGNVVISPPSSYDAGTTGWVGEEITRDGLPKYKDGIFTYEGFREWEDQEREEGRDGFWHWLTVTLPEGSKEAFSYLYEGAKEIPDEFKEDPMKAMAIFPEAALSAGEGWADIASGAVDLAKRPFRPESESHRARYDRYKKFAERTKHILEERQSRVGDAIRAYGYLTNKDLSEYATAYDEGINPASADSLGMILSPDVLFGGSLYRTGARLAGKPAVQANKALNNALKGINQGTGKKFLNAAKEVVKRPVTTTAEGVGKLAAGTGGAIERVGEKISALSAPGRIGENFPQLVKAAGETVKLPGTALKAKGQIVSVIGEAARKGGRRQTGLSVVKKKGDLVKPLQKAVEILDKPLSDRILRNAGDLADKAAKGFALGVGLGGVAGGKEGAAAGGGMGLFGAGVGFTGEKAAKYFPFVRNKFKGAERLKLDEEFVTEYAATLPDAERKAFLNPDRRLSVSELAAEADAAQLFQGFQRKTGQNIDIRYVDGDGMVKAATSDPSSPNHNARYQYGLFDPNTRAVYINTDVSGSSRNRTLFHELFHPTEYFAAPKGKEKRPGLTKLDEIKGRPSWEAVDPFKDIRAELEQTLFGTFDSAGNKRSDGVYTEKQMLDFENQYLDAVYQLTPGSPQGRRIAEARRIREKAITEGDLDTANKASYAINELQKQQQSNVRAKENYLKGDIARRRKNITAEILSENFANFGEKAHFGLVREAKKTLLKNKFKGSALRHKMARLGLSTLGKMRQVLAGKGVTFDAGGKPKGDIEATSSIFIDPLTGERLINSPEGEHLLAQYIVALEEYNQRLALDTESSVDLFENAKDFKDKGRDGLTPEKENQLREIGWLEEIDSSGIPVFSTARQRNKWHKENVAKVIDTLNANPEDEGEPKMWRKVKTKKGRDRWEGGIPSEKQMEALRNSDIDPSYVRKIEMIRNAILEGDGTIFGNDYYKALTGGKYDSRASVKFRLMVPFALEATQAGNINIRSFNVSKLENKITNWQTSRPKFFDEWKGDTDAFRRDVIDFFQGPSRGKKFPEGKKKDLIYQFMQIGNQRNPLSGEFVEKSGGMIESNRIERSTNLQPLDNLDKIPFDYGKMLEKQYMPAPGEGAEIKRTDPDIDIFDNSVRSLLPSFDDSNNHPKFLEFKDKFGFDRRFHLNLLADRVLNDFFRNKSDLEVHRRVVEREGSEEAAQSLYEERMQFGSTGYDQVARNKGLMYPEIKSLFADFFASLPADMKGIDARTGETVNPVQPSLDFFGKGEVRPLDDILGDISNLLTSVDPNRSKGVDRLGLSRDILGLADIAREAGADISQGAIDKIFKKVEGMTEAEVKAANAKVMSKFPEFFDKQQAQGGVDVYKKIDPDDTSRFMPAPSEGTFNKAKETFGITKDPLEAGYVLPDGEMLDFSGRHEGADERDIKGWRYSDHRDISQIGTEMTPFIDSGAVRIDVRNGLIELGKEPTASQLNVIRKIIEDKNSEVFIDLKDPNKPDVADWFETIQPEPGTDPKRVIGLIRRFYRGDDISGATSVGRFMPAPTFYSKAERAVEGAKGGVFDKSGMTTVEKAVALFVKEKKGDKQWQVPEAEVEWSGVVDWLEGRKEDGEEGLAIWRPLKDDPDPKVRGVARAGLEADEAKAAGKVSKAELLEFLQNKGVKVEEVVRGKAPVTLEKLPDSQNPDGVKSVYSIYRADDPSGAFYGSVGQIVERSPGKLKGAISEIQGDGRFEVNVPEVNTARFKTLEEAKDYVKNQSGLGYNTLFKPGESDWVMLPGDEKAKQSYGELVLTLPKERGKSHETFDLPSGHRFPEENILAHIRFTERVDADGKKMLFIEELQSDWSNTGRRSGWRQERPAKVQKEIVKLQDEKATLQQNFWKPYYALEWAPLDVRKKTDKAAVREAMIASKKGKKFTKEIDRLDVRIDELQTKYPHEPAGAPDMPFKGDNRYGALALKRMIRWASDNGFDRLGWITGKDTAERYDLSKQVDNIYFHKNADKTYSVKADTVSGDQVDIGLNLSADELAGSVGKDVADKIVNYEPGTLRVTEITARTGKPGRPQKTYWSTLSGEDLKVGGEWATTLYDKVLPTQAKKIVKKKGAVGRTRLGGKAVSSEMRKIDAMIKTHKSLLRKDRKELARLEGDIGGTTPSFSRTLAEAETEISRLGKKIEAISEKVQVAQTFEGRNKLLEELGFDAVTDKYDTLVKWRSTKQEILHNESELQKYEAQAKKLGPSKANEANYVDITPEVKALAEEGFSYFMPPGAGRGRAAAPAQPTASTLPATPIMPRVKLTEEEKEDSRRLLNLLKEKGI